MYSESEEFDLQAKAMSILNAREVEGSDNQVLEDYLGREDDMNVLVYLNNWVEMAKNEAPDVETFEIRPSISLNSKSPEVVLLLTSPTTS